MIRDLKILGRSSRRRHLLFSAPPFSTTPSLILQTVGGVIPPNCRPQMRLFLLPIASRRTLIYFDRTSLKTATSPQTPPSIIDKLTTKATTTWASWERAESGWQKKLTTYGDAVFRRIPYQEWGLKSIPPLNAKAREDRKTVEVVFPGTYLKESKVGEVLKRLALERQPLHQKRMIWSLIGAPLTLPCALVPM